MVLPRYDARGQRVNGGAVLLTATVLLVAVLAWWGRRFAAGAEDQEPDAADAVQVLGGWATAVPVWG
ncbi:hypothetical protein [Cellulomonas phragmiteti]|uniref:Uncharacterized protein n=1 Tax=Cellulomonas phragmiteti TaxID=478780 RepID=A0ABQ4DQC8_9CELL|nr:hypothetical protein [Cellulomonas phragmiteti]GIG41566.1 hypothetical protein Cph01nite_33280 [Cellulomonas phragmiteti]